jgi:hypothetical protein
MFNNQVIAGSSGQGGGFYDFLIEQSLRFNDDDSAYLNRTPASAGNRKTWTFSAWIKLGSLSQGERGTIFSSSGGPTIYQDSGLRFAHAWDPAGTDYVRETVGLFRDTSAWYHVVWWCDTTQAGTRWKIYVNGTEQTLQTPAGYNGEPAQNTDLNINSTNAHTIGNYVGTYFDGYMAEVNFIDGQALDATSFGEFKSGIWIPKDTAGLTFGTNGFRLQYGDSAAIGDDTSGNTNDWTVNNLVASDVVLDSPTNNWCVWNPLEKTYNTGTPSDGNLTVANSVTCGGTIAIPDDGTKIYFESANVTALNTSGGNFVLGVHEPNNTNFHVTSTSSNAWIIYAASGGAGGSWRFIANGTTGYIASPAPTTAGTVHGCAVWKDGSNWKVYISRGGTWYDSSGTALGSFTEGSPTFTFSYDGLLVPFGAGQANFGQSDFTYTPPDNYVALNSANLPTGAINTLNDETPEDYFNTVTFTGTGSSNSVTGVGFEPSLTWFKNRSAAYSHQLVDQVRGKIGSDSSFARLASNLTNAEATPGGDDGLTSFDSDGFTVLGDESYNSSGQSMVAWNWKANGSGVSNTDGSITSTVSVGATSQQNWFSIVSWTGTGANATVGHGLDGTVPDLVIVKNRDIVSSWLVRLQILATNQTLLLENTTTPISTDYWQSTQPDSSVITVSSNSEVNGSGNDLIAYCFANAEGLCKVGSYGPGTGNSDGPFVYTGFRPAFILVKSYDTALSWIIWDNKRLGRNPTEHYVVPNLSNAESSASSTGVDFLSNGFKFRGGSGAGNLLNANYIYLAIAEQPFAFANAR